MNFTRVASDAFRSLQLDAGVLLSYFDPSNPYVTPTDAQIIATTTGGINPVCNPTYSDLGEDVDNVPNGTKELLKTESWECSLGFTSLTFNAAGVKLALGVADVTTLSNGVKKIAPRRNLAQGDFTDIWWVGDLANGGAAAICLKNALSTGGLSMQTTKNGKGTLAVTISGHFSLTAQNEVPMEFYIIPPQSGATTLPVTQNLNHATSSFSGTSVTEGGSLSATITPDEGYELTDGDVTVMMGGVDITALCVTISTTASVSIGKVTSGVIITVNASEEG